MKNFREALRNQVIIGDGAMGTYLYQLGYPVGVSYERLNMSEPDVIYNIHRQYMDAGAQLLETNTFTANREKLSKHGAAHLVKDMNRSAVRLAREAAQNQAYVIGALGSIRAGKYGNIDTDQVAKDYYEQLSALLEEGVDGIMFETFYDIEEMRLVMRIVRDLDPKIPIICQFVAEDSNRTKDGTQFLEAFHILHHDGADVVGLNCRTGPNSLLRVLETVKGQVELPLSAFPNAGLPDYVDGRYHFVATAEYMAQRAVQFAQMGARIIGGCCGTTPEHIQAISRALQHVEIPELPVISRERKQAEDEVTLGYGHDEMTYYDSCDGRHDQHVQQSIVDIVRSRHAVIVELDPPRDLDISKFIQGSRALKASGADALTLADNSLAVTRISNMALGYMALIKSGIRPLVHIACRDRNLIGTQSHMMGLHILGINHVLAVTGDPARFGDLPDSSSVYDLTSFEIIRMIKQLNTGLAFSGKSLKQRANFVVGCAFNPNMKHLDKAIARLERKIEAGADYIMTQPVYEASLIERIAEATKHISVPLFIGIMPLASDQNAEYLHNEVPGIVLSDEIRSRMRGLKGKKGREEGITIAKELLDIALQYFNGIYFITPFLFYEMTAELTRYVWEKANH